MHLFQRKEGGREGEGGGEGGAEGGGKGGGEGGGEGERTCRTRQGFQVGEYL